MSDATGVAPRHVEYAAIAATSAASISGSVVVSAALTGGASPYMIDPGAFVSVLMVSMVIAFLHIWLLGLPLYLFVARRWKLRWWNTALAGCTVGALPIAVLIAPMLDRNSARELLPWVAWAGAYGTLAGLAFFAVLQIGARRTPT